MLTVLSSGLPSSARSILSDAMNTVFDGAVVVQELSKENLRSRVRLSSRSIEVVLVVLDGVSEDTCRDIEGGLYSSEKYYRYVSDRELIIYLNSKYNLSIPMVEEEKVIDSVSTSNDSIGALLGKIRLQEDYISSLEQKIQDIHDFYCSDEGVQYLNAKDEEVKNSVVDVAELENAKYLLTQERVKIGELESTISTLKEVELELKNRLESVSKNRDELVSELEELKVTHNSILEELNTRDREVAKLGGMITSLNKTIAEKDIVVSNLEKSLSELRGIRKELSLAENTINVLRGDLSKLQATNNELNSKVEEVNELRGTLGEAEENISRLEENITSLMSENNSLKEEIEESNKKLSDLEVKNKGHIDTILVLEKNISVLNERIDRDDASLFELNKERIELQNRVNLLEKASESEGSVDNLIAEISDLQNRLSIMSSSIFNNIENSARGNTLIEGRVFSGLCSLENVKFVFSGTSESKKGTYSCLKKELSELKDGNKYLILDLVSETFIDYVFGIEGLVPGLKWLKSGGNLSRYISRTILDNTYVLSMGLGYVNDSYFLCVDWNKRLEELNNSGYKVIVFCGDISNLVGRVLHESFASYSKSEIYTVGNVISSRSLIINLRGLSNKGDSDVIYYEFNPELQKFYDIVSKTNKCRILSTKSKGC